MPNHFQPRREKCCGWNLVLTCRCLPFIYLCTFYEYLFDVFHLNFHTLGLFNIYNGSGSVLGKRFEKALENPPRDSPFTVSGGTIGLRNGPLLNRWKISTLTSTSSFINLSNQLKEANGFCVISHFAKMGLFNSLHSTFTSYKAPKMKLNSNACHTAQDLYCQQKSDIKEAKKRDSKYLLRLVVLFSSHLSEALRGGNIILFEFLPINSPGFVSMM